MIWRGEAVIQPTVSVKGGAGLGSDTVQSPHGILAELKTLRLP
jgi:hypothetical protein